MTTNIIPSLGVKGNNKTLGFTNGSQYGGVFQGQTTGLQLAQSSYGTNINTNYSGGILTANRTVGLTTDVNNSGIITNTGTMSAVSSRVIIKY